MDYLHVAFLCGGVAGGEGGGPSGRPAAIPDMLPTTPWTNPEDSSPSFSPTFIPVPGEALTPAVLVATLGAYSVVYRVTIKDVIPVP